MSRSAPVTNTAPFSPDEEPAGPRLPRAHEVLEHHQVGERHPERGGRVASDHGHRGHERGRQPGEARRPGAPRPPPIATTPRRSRPSCRDPSAAGRKAAVNSTCSTTAIAVATSPQASSLAMATRRRLGSQVSSVTKVPARHSAPIIDAPPTTAPISRKNAADAEEGVAARRLVQLDQLRTGRARRAWLADRWAKIRGARRSRPPRRR